MERTGEVTGRRRADLREGNMCGCIVHHAWLASSQTARGAILMAVEAAQYQLVRRSR